MTNIQVHQGDAADVLRSYSSEAFHMVFTSPPYYKKRKYGERDNELGQEEVPYCQDILAGAKPKLEGCCYMCHLTSRLLLAADRMRIDGTMWINIADTLRDGRKLLVPEIMATVLSFHGLEVISRIVWYIPNKMPESARHRPSRSYEDIYILRKASPKSVRISSYYDYFSVLEEGAEFGSSVLGRDIWTFPVHSVTRSAHFARMPIKLATKALSVGCPVYTCRACGMPYKRIVDREVMHDPRNPNPATDYSAAGGNDGTGETTLHKIKSYTHNRWVTHCSCQSPLPYSPGTVLDLFAGVGTTGIASRMLGVHAVLIEIEDSHSQEIDENLKRGVQLGLFRGELY